MKKFTEFIFEFNFFQSRGSPEFWRGADGVQLPVDEGDAAEVSGGQILHDLQPDDLGQEEPPGLHG